MIQYNCIQNYIKQINIIQNNQNIVWGNIIQDNLKLIKNQKNIIEDVIRMQSNIIGKNVIHGSIYRGNMV